MQILVVDDDEFLRQSLVTKLTDAGFVVSTAGDAAGAVDALATTTPDAVLLDVGLPDMDGRDLCRSLRQRGFTMPIIMLTAVDGEADTIRGLDSGASDYVGKPFRLGILLARLRAQLRQYEQSEAASFRIGHYMFHPATKLLVDEHDHKIRMTDKEVAIIRHLYRAKGAVARETLLHEAFGYSAGTDTHTIESHVYRLRQKIEKDPAHARILVTEPGGYRLVCD